MPTKRKTTKKPTKRKTTKRKTTKRKTTRKPAKKRGKTRIIHGDGFLTIITERPATHAEANAHNFK